MEMLREKTWVIFSLSLLIFSFSCASFVGTATPASSISATPENVGDDEIHTLTPLPTLLPLEKELLVAKLFETNSNCDLPCWWGIVPGQTEWASAKQFLESFAQYVERVENPEFPDDVTGSYYEAGFESPAQGDLNRILTQSYFVKDKLVRLIKADSFMTLQDFFKRYGEPDDIWIRSLPSGLEGYLQTSIGLYYSQGHILGIFSDTRSELNNGQIKACFEDGPRLWLWSSDQVIRAEDIPFLGIGWQTFVPFYEAAGQTVREFYNDSLGSEGDICLETPSNLWTFPDFQ